MAVQRKFIREAVNRLMIREYLEKETERAGFGGIQIQRTPMGTRVSILAERPGMVIGRKGSTINSLTEALQKRFKVENPQIEVIEAGRNAALNAQIMAIKLAEALERGWHFRRAGHSTVQRVMQAGAQGCQVIIAGKLTGQRHRTEKFSQGHLKYCGDTMDKVMDVGFAVCKKKLGVMGCTVRIMHPDAILPDNIKIFSPEEAAARKAPKVTPAAAADMAPPPPKPEEKPAEAPKKPRAPRAKKEPAPGAVEGGE
ncbi:MAG: 30S ribosomal protein S3 [Euryarchaeota archaeon]|nr:30S ribosomal protein S3 [Euryarchaeota archaeon]